LIDGAAAAFGFAQDSRYRFKGPLPLDFKS
jgi:hypothetical protein